MERCLMKFKIPAMVLRTKDKYCFVWKALKLSILSKRESYSLQFPTQEKIYFHLQSMM